ncbi:MAG TPA: hypothetical protein VKP08_13150 [Anaerolineales bacterium]|nr:hypothetical protein [Anaerolineales bacterium]
MKKQTLYIIFGVVVFTLACTLGNGTPAAPTQAQDDQVSTVVAATIQALIAQTPGAAPGEVLPSEAAPTQAPAQTNGIPVSLEYASFVISTGLATGATPESVPAVGEENGGPWDVAPAHLKFTLTGYLLQNKFHTPVIYVFPANEYAAVNPGAADQIKRTAVAVEGGPLQRETFPTIPFFNAGPLFDAGMQHMKFQSGTGVRELTQYAQYSAPVNNREMFYHFEGLSSDYKYYIIAILPITAPVLQEDENPQTPIPSGGVPFPADGMADQSYYNSVTEKLNALPPDSYTPSLSALDLLIESILVTNP